MLPNISDDGFKFLSNIWTGASKYLASNEQTFYMVRPMNWPCLMKYLAKLVDLIGPNICQMFDLIQPNKSKSNIWPGGTKQPEEEHLRWTCKALSDQCFLCHTWYSSSPPSSSTLISKLSSSSTSSPSSSSSTPICDEWPPKWCCGHRTCVYGALTVGKAVATPVLVGC